MFPMQNARNARSHDAPSTFKSCNDAQVDSRSALEKFAMATCDKADGVNSHPEEDFPFMKGKRGVFFVAMGIPTPKKTGDH